MAVLLTKRKRDDMRCCWCHEIIYGTCYVCRIHKNLFCEECALDHGKTVVKTGQTPSCHSKRFLGIFVNDSMGYNPSKHDCILEKFESIQFENEVQNG